jgi:hypothetical protein
MKPTAERPHPAGMGGIQKIYRFPNGYGASVIRFSFSHGGDKGLWELGVVEFYGEGDWDYRLTYETPVTDDVEGYLPRADVGRLLREIEALPKGGESE